MVNQQFINGNRWQASNLMTVAKTEEVKRTWKERLFSWPWRPLRKTKYVTTHVPSEQVIFAHGTYFAHPELIEKIRLLTLKETE
jgi:hypothetical protein